MPPRLSRTLTKGLAFFKTAVERRIARALRPAGAPVDGAAAPLPVIRIRNYHDYLKHVAAMGGEYERRKRIERDLITGSDSFLTPGRCYVCQETVDFYSDFQYAFRDEQGHSVPNWRERLVCPRCRLHNRMRASMHIFDNSAGPPPQMLSISPSRRHRSMRGSENAIHVPSAANTSGTEMSHWAH